MANEYNWGMNPFENTLLEIIIRGGDIATKKNKAAIYDIFKYILQIYLKNKNDVVYLDFEINNKNDYNKVIGNNIITALWLSGLMPEDISSLIGKNEFIADNIRYTFDNVKKILKQEII